LQAGGHRFDPGPLHYPQVLSSLPHQMLSATAIMRCLSHRRDPATGKRVRDSHTVRGSRRDAERFLRDLISQRETHGPSPTTSGRLTLDAWIKQHIASADLTARTRRDQLEYFCDLEPFVATSSSGETILFELRCDCSMVNTPHSDSSSSNLRQNTTRRY
jgi:hypothetical protein